MPHISILQTGSLFDSGCPVLVNPVNIEGICGKGLALAFKERFPAHYQAYKKVCEDGLLRPGSIFIDDLTSPCLLIAFATKRRWRDPSQLHWIKEGMAVLVETLNERPEVNSLALPALGCGLGSLRFDDVQLVIVDALQGITRPDFEVKLYAPQ